MKQQQLLPGIWLASTLSVLVSAPAFAQVRQVTGVQVETTPRGVEVILQTDSDTIPQVFTTSLDKTLLTDIFNTQLRLPEGQAFRQDNPAAGIASVTVTQQNPNTIRVAVTGTTELPTVEISPSPSGLVLSLSTPEATTQTPSPETPPPEAEDTQPPAEPEEEMVTPEPEEEIEIVVTAEPDEDRYFVPDASTATRTDTPLRDVPQSVQVIPQQIIEDQQAIGVEEVLENAAGVTFLGNRDGFSPNFSIRGFDNAPVLRNGFRLFGGEGIEPEVANLERVEVLRGPASVLFGQSEPGGVINLVTKQPLSEPYYNVQLQLGNRDFVSPSIDLSGPLTEDGRLLYRLNALYRHQDSFRDFDNSFERFFIAPSLAWQIGDQTDLTINLEYFSDDDPADLGTVAFGDGIADIPLERVTNNPDDTVEQDYLNVGYTLEHRFNENWQLSNQFRYISQEVDFSVIALPFALDEATGILNRGFADQIQEDDTYALYTNIQGEFSTGSVEHTLLFGVDLARVERENETRFAFDPLTPINIFDPDYSAIQTPDSEDLPLFNNTSSTSDRLGIYLQDQIDILDNLILVAGLRYDIVDQDTTNFLADTETNQYDDAVIPRIGIVYQPIEPISLYANYSRSFTPNLATDADGEPLEPEEGEGFEVGIRAEIIENRLSTTLAYFNITKQNVATPDPDDLFASVATGEQRSRGVDFDVTGEILPGWNVIASYAYIDAEVTEDNADIVGNRLLGVPEHSASLWTTYEIQSGDLQGLGFGLGFNFVGERQGDLANSFEVDSYFLTNAAIFYRRNNWQVRLNVDNLFDVDYIESVGRDRTRFIYPGAPLTVRASVSVEF
ncbi:MAG: TonB-dependent receptor [Coleofasciculus sp. C1-SOL-03]|uniref:TonB-dependent siderophore receptor n=1 Tax=Coleofasciculus sp. C1-SOL-03 TaxID=3069522 RepID=UPI0032F78E83